MVACPIVSFALLLGYDFIHQRYHDGLLAKSGYIVRRKELAMWQDTVIATIQWLFVVALIPAILHPTQKPPLWSSVMTAALMGLLSFTFWTLHLVNATLSASAVTASWCVLAIQRWKIEKADP